MRKMCVLVIRTTSVMICDTCLRFGETDGGDRMLVSLVSAFLLPHACAFWDFGIGGVFVLLQYSLLKGVFASLVLGIC